ncbi:MAG: serine/threonine-protein kinase [Polyangiaceae bacterium]
MEPGHTIAGKYRLNQLLGTGGMATVWSATNVFTERQFAIKFMLPSLARTPEAARRFLMEAKASARINHPNIIEVIDVGQSEDGALFMVMELLSGTSLETAMRRMNPPMMAYELALIMLDVARALAAAHANGVIHRDLKPSNIFLHKDRNGVAVPKLLDFGVSKFLEEEGSTALTIAGTVLGSPMYMSPEQAKGAAGIDHRTDVFAFGSILFEALVGFRCYDAPNFNALIVAIATTKPLNIYDCGPHVAEPLRALIAECLVVDRDTRISSFEQIVDRLDLAMPILKDDIRRIPPPRRDGPSSDPDATNALPAIVRPSDRPPPAYQQSSTPGMMVPGLQQRGPNFSVTTMNRRGPFGGSLYSKKVGMIVAASILGVGILVSTAMLFFNFGTHQNGVVSAPPLPVAPSPVPAPAPSEDEIEPPVVSVDTLPVVNGKGPTAPVYKGTGHLLVAATPWCTLFVDGSTKGPTPVSVELGAGPHQLRCDPPTGKPKISSVTILDGATARFKFTFD